MLTSRTLKMLLGSSAIGLFTTHATIGADFNIPGGDLRTALNAYTVQTGVHLLYAEQAITGVHTSGIHGSLSPDEALSRILKGTGFTAQRDDGSIAILRKEQHTESSDQTMQLAQAAPPHAAVETVTVTSSKLGGADIQNIPISITALSQEQLTSTQTAGGPDLVKQVPNMTFTKTNFSGYSIQLRGIGTQAISVTTDPAVAVAFNDVPFIRNHFFEQEFYDVSQVEVLRGPQGTLYGRNATAGVVNLISAKPTDQFEAMASLDVGNYGERRPEGMINIPIVDDRFDIRIAGEWTKRQGYSLNENTGDRVDGRDLWSGRLSIAFKPFAELQTSLVWEHFSEDDDRMRTSKQLCKTDPLPTSVDGVAVPPIGSFTEFSGAFEPSSYLSQSCELTSLYSPDAFEVPEGLSLGFVKAAKYVGWIVPNLDPYAETTQSTNLRVIQTTVNPAYKAKNDVVEFNADYTVTPALTFTSQTGFNHDFLWSTEDYNRFDTTPGIFTVGTDCDPQVGCSTRLVAQDLSDEHAWQLSQEFRLVSNFSGPFNFSVGGNYLHYETEENYYVFINALSAYASAGAATDANPGCLFQGQYGFGGTGYGFVPLDPRVHVSSPVSYCIYVDTNPIPTVNNEGHNYFLSQNPYTLNSYAGFGEAYYNVLPDLKLTTGLRWTEDQKHFDDIPSELLTDGWGYFQTGVVKSAMGSAHGPGRYQLDTKARFHRPDAGLCFLRAWLQGRWRQSARRGAYRQRGGRHYFPRSSADVQTGIHRCVRTGLEEHAARRVAYTECRCLLLQL